MADIASQINQLTPEQRQAVMMRAKQEADQAIFSEMMKRSVVACFEKCVGTSVSLYITGNLYNTSPPYWGYHLI